MGEATTDSETLNSQSNWQARESLIGIADGIMNHSSIGLTSWLPVGALCLPVRGLVSHIIAMMGTTLVGSCLIVIIPRVHVSDDKLG
jgi:hypothetical protein